MYLTNTTIGWQTISFIAANGSANESIDWPITNGTALGARNISVKIHLDDMPQETDGNESNNQAEKEIKAVTFRVLVVGTRYPDESPDNLTNYETQFNDRLLQVTHYYLVQSFGQEYIGFSHPIYTEMPHPSSYYPNKNLIDQSMYTPWETYAWDVWDRIPTGLPENYDTVLTYQTTKAAGTKAFREIIYFKEELMISKDVLVLCTSSTKGKIAHELAHSLYHIDDLYPNFPWINRGDVGSLDLMGLGGPESESPISSFNRVSANWQSYEITSETELHQSKIFNPVLFENMAAEDKVIKIANIPDFKFSCDYIIEARNGKGVYVYQDTHNLVFSFLKNIPNKLQSNTATLNSVSSVLRDPLTGLVFECIHGNPCVEEYGPNMTVVIGYNVSGNRNTIGRILEKRPGNFTNNSQAPPRTRISRDGFNAVSPIYANFTNESRFRIGFFNYFDNNSVKVKEINVSYYSKDYSIRNCNVVTQMPVIIPSNQVFYVDGSNCSLDSNYPNVGKVHIALLFSIVYPNGTVSPVTHLSLGDVLIYPENNITPSLRIIDFIWLGPIAFFVLLGLLLRFIHKKYGKFKLLLTAWFIAFMILLTLYFYVFNANWISCWMNVQHNDPVSGQLSPAGNLTYPDVNLHAYTSDGLHTGINYTTGIYENQIPGAIASGDAADEEWIFVPSNLSVHFVVDSHDVQQYLNELNSTENLTLNYSIQQMVYGPNPSVEIVNDSVVILDRTVSEPINGSIGPGEQVIYAMNTTLENCFSGGVGICGTDFCCGAADNVCPTDFEGITCGVSDPDCGCSHGGLSFCGGSFCCGVNDGVCPTDFDGVSCTVSDPDCSCSYGGVSICGNNFCCGSSDGVCPSDFEGVSCSTSDVDCV